MFREIIALLLNLPLLVSCAALQLRRPESKIRNVSPTSHFNETWTLKTREKYGSLLLLPDQRPIMGTRGSRRATVDPHSCSRITCDVGNGIFICNDNNDGMRPLLIDFAPYVTEIITRCSTTAQRKGFVCGQKFVDKSVSPVRMGFNVIIAKQNCQLPSSTIPGL